MKANSKSIEQLENSYWREEIDFPSRLVLNCYNYRKIPIKDLTIEQLRLLISQKIGLQYLIEIVFEKLQLNILAEGGLYKGDLLEAVLGLPREFWNEQKLEFQLLKNLIKQNSELIKTELGYKKLNQINEKIIAISQQTS